MGLETATFISGLTASWPLAGDQKSVGDDHIRLIKTTLQATFPGASKAFYFPKLEGISGAQVLDITDQNNVQAVDTTGGNVSITLPALAPADAGWTTEILKYSSDSNAVIVTPTSGTIISKCGTVASIRVGIVCEAVKFLWSGFTWFCSKPGPMIGSTESFDGTVVPPGYLLGDGGSYSNVAYAELFAVLGTSVLRDKRGRYEIGTDPSQVNMPASAYGAAATLGQVKGGATFTLGTGNLPAYTPAGSVSGVATIQQDIYNGTSFGPGAAGFIILTGPSGTASFGTHFSNSPVTGSLTGTPQGGTSVPVPYTPPSIAVNKIIRAC